jgi:hypothetical protein
MRLPVERVESRYLHHVRGAVQPALLLVRLALDLGLGGLVVLARLLPPTG